MSSTRTTSAGAAVAALGLALALAACGGSSGGPAGNAPSAAAPAGSSAATGTKTQYPVDITDCGGRKTTYSKAPERVVTLDPAVAEMLLLLGLKDRIVGYTEFQTPEQHWPTTKADLESLNQLNKGSTDYPSKEAVVAAAPDLVTSIYPSALESNDKLPTREGWAALGVNSYETGAECHKRTEPVTDLSVLYQDLTNFGVLFDVQDKAQTVITAMKARVDAAQAKAKAAGISGMSVMSYSGEKDPYPAGGIGTPNAIISMAGASNTFADVKKDYDAISWEEIVKRNPDVIWLMTAAGPGFIDEGNGIKDTLSKDSRVAGVTAVKNKAYVQVSYNDGGIETPRNVDALEQMVDGMIALKK